MHHEKFALRGDRPWRFVAANRECVIVVPALPFKAAVKRVYCMN
jgi:hypothetical protein